MKGGESNISSVAKMVLNDYQRGKLPYYVLPPGCDKEKLELKQNTEFIEEVLKENAAENTESTVEAAAEDVDGEKKQEPESQASREPTTSKIQEKKLVQAAKKVSQKIKKTEKLTGKNKFGDLKKFKNSNK